MLNATWPDYKASIKIISYHERLILCFVVVAYTSFSYHCMAISEHNCKENICLPCMHGLVCVPAEQHMYCLSSVVLLGKSLLLLQEPD